MKRQSIFLADAMLVFSAVESTSSLSLVQHVQVLSGSVDSATFRVQRDSGKVTVQSRVLPVQIQLPSNKTVPVDALMFYDPRRKAFWWDRLPLGLNSARLLPQDSAMFVTDSKFTIFWNGWVSGGYIMIQSSDHVSSLHEGRSMSCEYWRRGVPIYRPGNSFTSTREWNSHCLIGFSLQEEHSKPGRAYSQLRLSRRERMAHCRGWTELGQRYDCTE